MCVCVYLCQLVFAAILWVKLLEIKSSTSFGWGEGGNVTSAGWQVTLCDLVWHVSSRSGEASC